MVHSLSVFIQTSVSGLCETVLGQCTSAREGKGGGKKTKLSAILVALFHSVMSTFSDALYKG